MDDERTAMAQPLNDDVKVAASPPTGVLAHVAATGIYLVRGVPRDLQRAARRRAVREGTTLRSVLLKALSEYAAGRWVPQPDHDGTAKT